ncbi:MAG TPA: MBL fold metallo-hydrolase [Thermoanaerobaculia bacterium]|nr:MBL fold metallo-hydrolase [Thermoanaerobaculia bacterium]
MRHPLAGVVALCAIAALSPASRSDAASPDAGLRVTLLGTGNPRPSFERFGPSILIETASGRRVLLDAGRGATMRLWQVGGAELLASVDVVLLTHLHSDHVVGLPDVWLTGWLFGRKTPLRVIGPRGTAELVEGLKRAYAFDVKMRRDVDERLPGTGAELVAEETGGGGVLDSGGLRVTAFAVDHGVVTPALGYRIDAGGRSAVFSGDTRPSEALVEAARGVDLLVHEVVSPEVERRVAKIQGKERIERVIAHHTTPEEAGRIFARAKPRLAVYSHIVPSPATAADLVPPTRKTYAGPLVVGEDLVEIDVGEKVTTKKRAQAR